MVQQEDKSLEICVQQKEDQQLNDIQEVEIKQFSLTDIQQDTLQSTNDLPENKQVEVKLNVDIENSSSITNILDKDLVLDIDEKKGQIKQNIRRRKIARRLCIGLIVNIFLLGIGFCIFYYQKYLKEMKTINIEPHYDTKKQIKQKERNIQFDQEIFDNYQFETPMDQLKKRAQNLDIIGHRGGFEPGNTMKSLEKAKEFGLKKVEIDIELSKDSIPFVLHAGFRGEMDSFVKERGHFIQNYTAEELDQIQLTKEGDTIPRFEQALKYCAENDIYVLIDIKGFKEEILNITVDLVEKYDMLDRVEMISFIWKYPGLLQSIFKEKNLESHNIPITQIYGHKEFNMQKAKKLEEQKVNSVTIACSAYDRQTLNEIKFKHPNMRIDCWWYRWDTPDGIKQESFEGYLEAIDRDINAVTVDFPGTYERIVQEIIAM